MHTSQPDTVQFQPSPKCLFFPFIIPGLLRRCSCVCHFDCRTLAHKEREYRDEGFRHCKWDSDKAGVLRKARGKCKARIIFNSTLVKFGKR